MPRQLDYSGYVSSQDPRTLPGAVPPPQVPAPIRQLKSENNIAPITPPATEQPSTVDQFQSIIKLLQQAQSGGLQEQALREASTPSNLIGASPGQQEAARRPSVEALSPILGGIKTSIENYKDALDITQKHAESVMSTILNTTDPASLKNLDPKYLNKLEQDAGYPKGFIQSAVTYKQKQAALAAQKALKTSGGNQDKLEQQYRQTLLKEVSSRSGGLGLEDQKVNQANHLKALIEQNYDPKTGRYNIPRTLYNELTLGLARLVSPTGQVGVELQRELNQITAKGKLNEALTYLTGTPFNGSTQDIYRMLIDSIDRQGQVAQTNRDQYLQFLHSLAPTELDPSRIAQLESGSLNNYNPINRRQIRNKEGDTKLYNGITYKIIKGVWTPQ